MSMNVLETLICAISMQLVTILKEVTPALATVDTQAMGYFAQVSASTFQTEYIALLARLTALHSILHIYELTMLYSERVRPPKNVLRLPLRQFSFKFTKGCCLKLVSKRKKKADKVQSNSCSKCLK